MNSFLRNVMTHMPSDDCDDIVTVGYINISLSAFHFIGTYLRCSQEIKYKNLMPQRSRKYTKSTSATSSHSADSYSSGKKFPLNDDTDTASARTAFLLPHEHYLVALHIIFIQVSLLVYCAVLCQIVLLQYVSRSSRHRLAGLPCRLSSWLMCPAQDHFIFLTF